MEPADAEFRVLNSMPMEVQIARLTQVLGDINTDNGERRIRLYADAWANGDMSALERAFMLIQQPSTVRSRNGIGSTITRGTCSG